MKRVIVTTSWDDGHILDLKLASLLKKYGIKGTFYVAPLIREISVENRLTSAELKELSKDFEIGAHTVTHPRFSKVDYQKAQYEIEESKQILEGIIGKPVLSFCYPGGDFNERHKLIAKKSGYRVARSTRRLSSAVGADKFGLPTTIQAYRHLSDLISILRLVGTKRFWSAFLNWDDLAILLFEKIMSEGGVFHLWGHSWEIEKNNDWQRLEKVLKHIGKRQGVSYVNNCDLV